MVSIAEASTDVTDALTLAHQLRPILLRLQRRLRLETKALGITSAQVALLSAIACTPGVGLSDLAKDQEMTTPSLCGHIDRCEAAGLVTRRKATSGDMRRVGISVTAQGLDLLDRVKAQRTAWLADRLSRLPEDHRAVIADALAPLASLLQPR